MSFFSSSNLKRHSLLTNLSKLEFEHKIAKRKETKQKISVLYTVKNNPRAVNYQTFWLCNSSLHFDDTVLSRVARQVKKVTPQLNVHIFDAEDPISTVGFLITSKLAYDTNNINERKAMCAPPNYGMETPNNALNSRACADVRNGQQRFRKLLCSCPEVVNYLLKKYGNDKAIGKTTQQSSVTLNHQTWHPKNMPMF